MTDYQKKLYDEEEAISEDLNRKTIKVTKWQINEIFEKAGHQQDVVVGLYKLAYPDWDDIILIDGFPKCDRGMQKYIFDKFIDFDHKHHPNVIKGGLWMNNGFSTLDSEHLDWEIDIEGIPVKYKD